MNKTTTLDELIHRIRLANLNRDPDGLRRKYAAMAQNAFRFFRATPSLFYQDWCGPKATLAQPVSWLCADLHLENFGSYRAANKLVYFDINDFDEALLAPISLDIARLITSLAVVAPTLKYSPPTVRTLAQRLMTTYVQTLRRGKPQSVERGTARGVLQHFLHQVAQRSRKILLAEHTRGSGKHRQLRRDQAGQSGLSAQDRAGLLAWLTPILGQFADCQLVDVAHRVAGTSSLGLPRYVLLVKNGEGKWRLLDLKAARPSAAAPWVGVTQPDWPDQATRVVRLQERLQDVAPARLTALPGPAGQSFVLRTLQPQADRVDLLAHSLQSANQLGELLETMAQLTASAHLRSSGHQGSATADALMAFAEQPDWGNDLIEEAIRYAGQVQLDFVHVNAARKAGAFNLTT